MKRNDFKANCKREREASTQAREAVRVIMGNLPENGKKCDKRFRERMQEEFNKCGITIVFGGGNTEWTLMPFVQEGIYKDYIKPYRGIPSICIYNRDKKAFAIDGGVMKDKDFIYEQCVALEKKLTRAIEDFTISDEQIDEYQAAYQRYYEAAKELQNLKLPFVPMDYVSPYPYIQD